MKRLTKTFVSLVVIVALIMPMLAMLTNTGSVEAATGYRTVIVRNSNEIFSKYDYRKEKIASYSTSRYYRANYWINFGLDNISYCSLYNGQRIYVTRLDTNQNVAFTITNLSMKKYYNRRTRRSVWTVTGSVYGSIDLGWRDANKGASSPRVRIYIQHYGSSYSCVTYGSVTYIDQRMYYNLVPITTATAASYPSTNRSAGAVAVRAGTNNGYIGGMSIDGRRQLVRDLYKRALKRNAAEWEVNVHYNQDPVKIATGIVLSNESYNTNKISKMDNKAFATFLYKVILNRNPDSGGLKTNTNFLSNHTKAQLVSAFTQSNEFKGKYK